jgi:hypothetical protein
VAESGGSSEGAAAGGQSEDSLTQLLARILNQLSISAWLPAAGVVVIALLYANLRSHQDDPVQALQAISSMGWGSLILSVGAIVLVTMLTQAFGFEVIRLLEGYWGGGWIGGGLAKLGCRWHRHRRRRLENRLVALEQAAFDHARRAILADEDFRWTAPILEADVYGHDPQDRPISASQDEIERARRIGWYTEARTGDVRRIEEVRRRLKEDYPDDDYRLMPTRLGNVLRAGEDRSHDPRSGSLRGSVQRVFYQLPSTVQGNHDQVRSRLDLYCTMVLVFVVAAPAAFLALGPWWVAGIAAAISLILALMSYRAAIASARSYVVILETIADQARRHPEDVSGQGATPTPAR